MRLSLSLTQPLLNGAGRFYNTSAVVLARIDAQVAGDRFARDLQSFLLELQTAYWDLYRERLVLLQKCKLLAEGRQIFDELEGRREVDVVKSQLARAKAAVATRDAAVVRQEALVLNAEARLRTLINDPELGTVNRTELVPVQPPIDIPQPVLLEDSLVLALHSRPEIDQAAREIRAASVRLDVSANELRPVLNFILASYVSGLEGDADISGAWADQFASGRPTYSAGLLFEYPFGNRQAQARLKKRRLELRQMTNQLEGDDRQRAVGSRNRGPRNRHDASRNAQPLSRDHRQRGGDRIPRATLAAVAGRPAGSRDRARRLAQCTRAAGPRRRQLRSGASGLQHRLGAIEVRSRCAFAISAVGGNGRRAGAASLILRRPASLAPKASTIRPWKCILRMQGVSSGPPRSQPRPRLPHGPRTLAASGRFPVTTKSEPAGSLDD